MIFSATAVAGAHLIRIEPRTDERGFFARVWCAKELGARGLNGRFVQSNLGVSRTRGTLRGLHYQLAPSAEAKLVRCTRGAIYDVIVDLRRDSVTYRRWFGVDLTAESHELLYVPEGVAHGYQTLTENAEVCYETTQFYAPERACGVRYDDPAFGIAWPLPVTVISQADRSWPLHGTERPVEEASSGDRR